MGPCAAGLPAPDVNRSRPQFHLATRRWYDPAGPNQDWPPGGADGMARGGQERAMQDNGDPVEAALPRVPRRAATLAQVVAEAVPPPLPVTEVQATIAAWAALPPSDSQRAALLATA